jgi:hypothetical protein
MREPGSSRPPLAGLLAKIVLAVVWLAAAGFAAWTLLNETPKEHDIAAAAFLIVAPAVWLIAKAIAMRSYDEVEVSVALRGLTWGLLFASVWPGIMIGGSVLSSLFLGAGNVNVSGMMQNAVTYVAIMPPIAFFLSELNSYAMLAVYGAKSEK